MLVYTQLKAGGAEPVKSADTPDIPSDWPLTNRYHCDDDDDDNNNNNNNNNNNTGLVN